MVKQVEIVEDAIYIHDDHGEIVMWHIDEWTEDPEVALSAMNALKLFYEQGPEALRKILAEIERYRCPKCQQIGNSDITIADHGMCYSCFQKYRETMGLPQWKYTIELCIANDRGSYREEWEELIFSELDDPTGSDDEIEAKLLSLIRTRHPAWDIVGILWWGYEEVEDEDSLQDAADD